LSVDIYEPMNVLFYWFASGLMSVSFNLANSENFQKGYILFFILCVVTVMNINIFHIYFYILSGQALT